MRGLLLQHYPGADQQRRHQREPVLEADVDVHGTLLEVAAP